MVMKYWETLREILRDENLMDWCNSQFKYIDYQEVKAWSKRTKLDLQH
jgi:hypothetical protein